MTSRVFGNKRPIHPHLARGRHGLAGEVADLRTDTDEAFEALENASGFSWCASVPSQGDLPPTGNTVGDVREVVDTGELFRWDGSAWLLAGAEPRGPAGGDLSGAYPTPTVGGLEGYPIESAPPTNGDALLFNGAMARWEHAPIVFGGGPPVGPAGGDLGGIYPNPQVEGLQGDALPSAVADGFLKRTSDNTAWEAVAYGSGSNTVCEGDDARLSDSRTPTGSAGGDLGGTYPDPSVVGVQGRPVDPSAPNVNDVYTWDGSKWTPSPLTSTSAYGAFSDSTTQPSVLPIVANTAYYMKFDTTELSNGVSVVNNTAGQPTRIQVENKGVYEFSYSVQLQGVGGTPELVSFWAVKNREDGGGLVPRSNSDTNIGGNAKTAIPYCSLILDLNAGDYIEFAYSSTGTGTTLLAIGTRSSPTRPADPSVIVNVKGLALLPG